MLNTRRLTFELSGRRRYDARPAKQIMYTVPASRAWWHAVGAPLERGVRQHWAAKGYKRWSEAQPTFLRGRRSMFPVDMLQNDFIAFRVITGTNPRVARRWQRRRTELLTKYQ